MKKLRNIVTIAIIILSTGHSHAQDFKLFEKSDGLGGFGGFAFNLYNGEHLFLSGEGAALFGNFYFGGFGYNTKIGTYQSKADTLDYVVRHRSGGLMIGAFSNTEHIFALFAEIKFGFDRFEAEADLNNNTTKSFVQPTYSIFPSLGAVVRPISFVQVQFYAGYTLSGDIDLNQIDDAPYNAPMFGISLEFGNF